ncbi:cytochrome c3 family protein [Campylobacter sp. 2018MI35]|uniref:cytochrome c3 family protein n=1 Tax=Campylobacter molothri TaxID=1032242 RepID=UPI001903DF87|nr:cytochrome c3 family protein [Campylobacter sp. 2018MI35]MBK2000012.1 cytochrome c3 family protein [Campylobacter sp. 2018MI35]
MKKIFISLLIPAIFLWAKNIAYSDEVVSLYLNKDDAKVIGKLLPTNPFEILKDQNNKVMIRISGYINPKFPSVIYFNNSQRIIVAAFSKNIKLNYSQIKKVEKGKWDKVNLEIWADKKDFSKDNRKMLNHAKELFVNNCGICHALHSEKEFNVNAWPAIFKSMVNRTSIDKKDQWLVIEYLQKNAKDFKIK